MRAGLFLAIETNLACEFVNFSAMYEAIPRQNFRAREKSKIARAMAARGASGGHGAWTRNMPRAQSAISYYFGTSEGNFVTVTLNY
jgi:hypothetical protein